MSGQYPWGQPYTPAQQAWLQQQAYVTQGHSQQYASMQGMQPPADAAAAQSFAVMQHNMLMHQRSVALSNANAAVQAAQQRHQQSHTATGMPPSAHAASTSRAAEAEGRGRSGQKRPREKPAGKPGVVKVPQNLLQLVPSKYRYAFNVGDSQEDIEQWRAARRRRYPSVANRAAVEQQEASKLQRGELLATTDTGNMRARRKETAPTKPAAPAATAPAAGGQGLVDYSSSDDDAAPEEKPSTALAQEIHIPVPGVQVAAAAAVPGVAVPVVVPVDKQEFPPTPAESPKPPPGRGKHNKGKQAGPKKGIVCGGEHLTASAVGSRAGTQRDASRGQKTQHRRGRQQRTSLLRQLLAGEMRKENSSILQCIRYLRQCEYLSDVPLHGAAPVEGDSSSQASDSDSDSDSDSGSSETLS